MTIKNPTLRTSETFLALNIGNTHVKAGLFSYSGPGTLPRLLATSLSKTHPIPTSSFEIKALWDELLKDFAQPDFGPTVAPSSAPPVAPPVGAFLAASVVPRFSLALKDDSRFLFLDQNSPFSFELHGAQTDSILKDGAESLPEDERSSTSVPAHAPPQHHSEIYSTGDSCEKATIKKTTIEMATYEKTRPYQNLGEIGMDRLVNIEACVRNYGTSCAVIDFGTATSISVVSRRNRKFYFTGGAIAPGVGLSIRTLVAGTAQLPQVSIGFSEKIIALSTTEAIQAGTVWGHLYMIESLITKVLEEASTLGDPIERVIFTGGLSSFLFPKILSIRKNLETYLLEPHLTLRGIAYFYDRI